MGKGLIKTETFAVRLFTAMNMHEHIKELCWIKRRSVLIRAR